MRKGGSIEMKAATAWRRRELPADRPDQAKRGDDSVAFVVHAVDEVGVVHAQSRWFCCVASFCCASGCVQASGSVQAILPLLSVVFCYLSFMYQWRLILINVT